VRGTGFTLGIVLGGLVGALFTSLTPFDEEEPFLKLGGQSGRAADVVQHHFEARVKPAQWQAAYADLVGDEAVQWPEDRFMKDLRSNPVRAVVPEIKVTDISSKKATVAITGTKWWRRSGCQLFTGSFTLERDGGFWLTGGSWRITGKGGGARPLRPDEIPRGWDCRTQGQKLRANERAIDLTSTKLRGSSATTGYPEANLVDHDPETAWVAHDPVGNQGTWLDIYLPKPTQVVRVDVKNGFGLDTEFNWINYDRAERVTLVNDRKEAFVGRLSASASTWQHLFVAFSRRTSAIRLNVDTYQDCREGLAISEIRVIGVKQPEDAATLRIRAKKVNVQPDVRAVDCKPPAPVDPAVPPG
jgi:hypothetical protein